MSGRRDGGDTVTIRACIVAAFIAVSAIGCGLPSPDEVAGQPVNVCSQDSDCPTSSTCVQSRCIATSYDLQGLLLEVRIDSNAGFAAGASYVVDPSLDGVKLVSNGAHDTPFGQRYDKTLPAPVTLHGVVVLDPSTPSSCGLADGSVPANITLYRAPKLAGLPFDPVNGSAVVSGSTAALDVDIVSGPDDRYDVYIEPKPLPSCPSTVAVPPRLITGQSIATSNKTANVVWQLPPASTLTANITGLTDLMSWQLDVVDPSRGLVVSSQTGAALKMGTKPYAQIIAQFSPLFDSTQSPILRLTPVPSTSNPAPSPPTIYWSLFGAISSGTQTTPVVSLTNDLLSGGTEVGGNVAGAGDVGVPSQVFIQSSMLDSMYVSNSASFAVQALTGPSAAETTAGQFTVTLPPGEYKVRAVPSASDGLAITDTPLVVNPGAMGCQCGQTFSLDAQPIFGGRVKTPDGAPFTATTVGVVASQIPARSYLEQTHLLPPIPVRQVLSTTDGSGSFSLQVDQGVANVTVQPDPATSFPWFVQTGVSLDMETVTLDVTSPAILVGTITDPDGNPVADAEVDAWYAVRDPSLAGTAVQIATTSTDANGNYTLILPSSVADSSN